MKPKTFYLKYMDGEEYAIIHKEKNIFIGNIEINVAEKWIDVHFTGAEEGREPYNEFMSIIRKMAK